MTTRAPTGLLSLPNEIIDQICDDICKDLASRKFGKVGQLNNLAKTCWQLFHDVLPTMYARYHLCKEQSVLWWACQFGRVETVRRAISTGYVTCEYGLLIKALHCSHVDVIAELIKVPSILQDWKDGSNADNSLYDGETPLTIATWTGNLKLVEMLLEKNPEDRALRKDANFTEDSALHIAVSRGDIKIAALLLSNGVPIDTLASQPDGIDGWPLSSPLHIAVNASTEASTALTEFLIAHHADVNIEDKIRNTPLHYALCHQNLRTIKVLLDAGASLSKLPRKPLEYALKRGDAKLLHLLMKHGIDVFDLGIPHHTPLSLAASYSNSEALDILLQLGADPKARTELDKESPLHAAPREGSDSCAQLLIDAGADVNALSEDGRTPLQTLLSHTSY